MKYCRKKPGTVAAVCYNGKNLKEIEETSENVRLILNNVILSLDTLEGSMWLYVGDYIIVSDKLTVLEATEKSRL